MFDRYTLREINYSYLGTIIVHHYIELIVIAMNESMLGKIDNSFKDFFKQFFDLLLSRYSLNSAKGVPIYQGHENSMPVAVDGGGHWKIILVK